MTITLNGTTGITSPAETLNRTGSDGVIQTFQKDGTTVGSINSASGNLLTVINGDIGLKFNGGLDSVYSCNGSGSTITNTVSLGVAGSRFKDLYLSGGVYVGGTAAANYLDDYEEGTWTPNVWHNSSNNSTWAVKNGYYKKIGSVVHCWFRVDAGTSGTAGSQLFITGIPFTPDGSNPVAGSFGMWAANGLTPPTGNVFWQSSNVFQVYSGGNGMTSQQTSYMSGYFSYNA